MITLPADFRDFPGALRGSPAVIVGASPSLDDWEPDALGAVLANRVVIGLNRAFLKVRCDVVLWQDLSLWTDEKDKLEALDGTTLVCKWGSIPTARAKELGVRLYRSDELPRIKGSRNSAPVAYQLARLLGCDPIYLLGVDCKYRGEKTNFYGVNKRHHQRTIPECLIGLEWCLQQGAVQL